MCSSAYHWDWLRAQSAHGLWYNTKISYLSVKFYQLSSLILFFVLNKWKILQRNLFPLAQTSTVFWLINPLSNLIFWDSCSYTHSQWAASRREKSECLSRKSIQHISWTEVHRAWIVGLWVDKYTHWLLALVSPIRSLQAHFSDDKIPASSAIS